MRNTILCSLPLALLAFGCGGKTPPAAGGEPAPAATAPATTTSAPAPAPMPEPEAAPAPKPPNADFKATITFADGKTKSGHVNRVERAEDWYGESGWTDKPVKLTVTVEKAGAEAEKQWTDFSEITIAYGKSTDMDCFFESSFDPVMYTCALRTTTNGKLADGSAVEVTVRNKWRFTYDDGSTVEFYLFKLPERAPDDTPASLDNIGKENQALYITLQDRAMATAKSAPTKIVISK